MFIFLSLELILFPANQTSWRSFFAASAKSLSMIHDPCLHPHCPIPDPVHSLFGYNNCLLTRIPNSFCPLQIHAPYCCWNDHTKNPSVVNLFFSFNILFNKHIRPFVSISKTKVYPRLSLPQTFWWLPSAWKVPISLTLLPDCFISHDSVQVFPLVPEKLFPHVC